MLVHQERGEDDIERDERDRNEPVVEIVNTIVVLNFILLDAGREPVSESTFDIGRLLKPESVRMTDYTDSNSTHTLSRFASL